MTNLRRGRNNLKAELDKTKRALAEEKANSTKGMWAFWFGVVDCLYTAQPSLEQ